MRKRLTGQCSQDRKEEAKERCEATKAPRQVTGSSLGGLEGTGPTHLWLVQG